MTNPTKSQLFVVPSDTSGATGTHIQKHEALIDDHISMRNRLATVETAAQGGAFTPSEDSPINDIPWKRSLLLFTPRDFRLDVTNPAVEEVAHGQVVHSMANGNILHAGDGYIPIVEDTQHDLILTCEMSTAVAGRSVRLRVIFYDKDNNAIRTSIFDPIAVPDTVVEFQINITDAIHDDDVTTATEGRIEIERQTASSADHPDKLRIKKVEVVHV